MSVYQHERAKFRLCNRKLCKFPNMAAKQTKFRSFILLSTIVRFPDLKSAPARGSVYLEVETSERADVCFPKFSIRKFYREA